MTNKNTSKLNPVMSDSTFSNSIIIKHTTDHRLFSTPLQILYYCFYDLLSESSKAFLYQCEISRID
ncbi:14654_t:CDS:1, partial [Funneliformis caledonium]